MFPKKIVIRLPLGITYKNIIIVACMLPKQSRIEMCLYDIGIT